MFDSVKLWELIAKQHFTQIILFCGSLRAKFESNCAVSMVGARKMFLIFVIFITLKDWIWQESLEVL